MNPTEIYDALAELAAAPFDPNEFPFSFAEATDAAKAAISKLRGSTNKSDLPGGVLFNRKFHYAPALTGHTDVTLEQLRNSKKTQSSKPAILIATDGETVAAEHFASGDTLHCRFDEIDVNYAFFLPAAGKERYVAAPEAKADIEASKKLAKLYDSLIKANPDWATDERRHDMNQLVMRLIFCMFAQKVGIFPDEQFSRLIFTHAGDRGEEMQATLIAAFRAMNLQKGKRDGLPFWTAELEYVNGGLFAGTIDAPHFDVLAFRYLREASGLNWREINPDIFGSMIQSVADPQQRSELGMHYTSVPNIMKVIGPLFLDDLDTQIHAAWDKPKGLSQVLDRLSGIRVFDPACGSGNFLVVSYRELRARETRVLQRLQEVTANTQAPLFSAIPITHFYGIEIADFAAETAKLALFIAEYQANAAFAEVFGRRPAALPLKDAANIRTGNALREDWTEVCPPPAEGQEVFIAGNPPWVWSNEQSPEQKSDMKAVFEKYAKTYSTLDYVSAWFMKTTQYMIFTNCVAAFVSTNSICQGQSVAYLWGPLLSSGARIKFAHTTFAWSNNAKANAIVDCVIVGFSRSPIGKCRLFLGDTSTECNSISPYLIPDLDVIVEKSSTSLFDLPPMEYGSKPIDGGNLIMSDEEVASLIKQHPESKIFIKRLYGSDELIYDKLRYYLHIDDSQVEDAQMIPAIAIRIDRVRKTRLASTDPGAQKAADRPHQFREHRSAERQSIYLPAVSSENRLFLTPIVAGKETGCTNRNFVLYDAPDFCVSLLSSTLHRIWVLTVCGKLQKRPNYSNTLGWNTFPVPNLTEPQRDALSASALRILRCRYAHYPKTIADLYNPEDMPDDLRALHRENDELLETMYIGRPFRNDTERLEKLFKLYAARVKSLDAKGGR